MEPTPELDLATNSVDQEQTRRFELKRKRISSEIRPQLEAFFAERSSPDKVERRSIAEATGLSYEQVTTWFSNRRKADARRLQNTDNEKVKRHATEIKEAETKKAVEMDMKDAVFCRAGQSDYTDGTGPSALGGTPTAIHGSASGHQLGESPYDEGCSILSTQQTLLPTEEQKDFAGRSGLPETECMKEEKRRLEESLRNLKQREKEEADRLKQLKQQRDEAEREMRRREKEEAVRLKELKRQRDEAEKELKSKEKEELDRRRELKRQKEEADREAKRKEKEESDRRKELKKQQEDAEKEAKRKEKEELERKKQMRLKKQASFMDRFLQKGASSTAAPSLTTSQCPTSAEKKDRQSGLFLPPKLPIDATMPPQVHMAKTAAMDDELSRAGAADTSELLRSYEKGWRQVRKSIASMPANRWGVRRLQVSRTIDGARGSLSKTQTAKRIDWTEITVGDKVVLAFDDTDCVAEGSTTDRQPGAPVNGKRKRKLLQYHENHRPAFYGSMAKTSQVISGRHPFKQDPSLDYDVDSDEEWEEEEPGESLSDLEDDKLDEDEEEKALKLDDEDSNDGFLVPDGYLSEDEGVHLDADLMEVDSREVDSTESEVMEPGVQMSAEELQHQRTLERARQLLAAATEHALKTQRPLIIQNFQQVGSGVDGSSQLSKQDALCIQALNMQVLSWDVVIDTPELRDDEEEETEKVVGPRGRPSRGVPDSILPDMVQFLATSTFGLGKNVELLSLKFPHVAKKQLELKIRELTDFTDNRWQVKGEVLQAFELPSCSISQGPLGHVKSPSAVKPITKFFLKQVSPSLVESRDSRTEATTSAAMPGPGQVKEVLPCDVGA